MTPEDRYLFVREQTEVWTNKSMLRHHIIAQIKEAMAEQKEIDAKVADSVNAFWVGNLIRARFLYPGQAQQPEQT